MEARRILRRIELEAYGGIVSAFRAEGPLTIEKKAVLTKLSQLLSISPDRHHAEVRRAICDEQLSFIADCVSGGTDSRRSWLPEGKRTGGRGNPRLVARHALSGTVQGQALAAITLSNINNKLINKQDQLSSSTEEIDRKPLPLQVQQALKTIAGQHQSSTTTTTTTTTTLSSVPSLSSRPKAPPTVVTTTTTTTLMRSISCQTDDEYITNTNTDLNTNPDINIDTNTNPDTNTDTNIDTITDSITDLNTNADTNIDLNTNPDTNIDLNINPDTNTDSITDLKTNTDTNIDINADTNTHTNTNLNTYPDLNTDTNTKPDLNTNPDTNTVLNTNADTNTDLNTDLNTDTNTDLNTDLNTDTNTDTNIDSTTTVPIDTVDIGVQVMKPLLVDVAVECNIIIEKEESVKEPHPPLINDKPHPSINSPVASISNEFSKPHPPNDEIIRKRTASLQEYETPPTKVLRYDDTPTPEDITDNKITVDNSNIANIPKDSSITDETPMDYEDNIKPIITVTTANDTTKDNTKESNISLIHDNKQLVTVSDTTCSDNSNSNDNSTSNDNSNSTSNDNIVQSESTNSSSSYLPLSFQVAPSVKQDTLILSSSFTSSIPAVPNLSSSRHSNSTPPPANVFFPPSSTVLQPSEGSTPSNPSSPFISSVVDENTLMKAVTSELGVDSIDPSLLNMSDLLSLLQPDEEDQHFTLSSLELSGLPSQGTSDSVSNNNDGITTPSELIVLQQSGGESALDLDFNLNEEELLDNLPEELRETVQAILDNP